LVLENKKSSGNGICEIWFPGFKPQKYINSTEVAERKHKRGIFSTEEIILSFLK
jgi:hypothetical protein